MQITTRKADFRDIPSVIELQELNLFANLSAEQRREGFVTTPFSIAQIENILLQRGLFVAENGEGRIIAYVFAADWEYFSQWEIFSHMVSRFPLLTFNGQAITTENSFQYGPICIDKAYRGRGLINHIFEEMRLEFSKRYPLALTFINAVNVVSEMAHTKKLGWEVIDRFEFGGKQYLGLVYSMEKSAL